MAPEGAAPPNHIFPHPRLRFVDPQRNRFAQRQAVVFGGQSLLVQAMTGLVHDGKEGRAEKLAVVAGGDAAIVRSQADGKRMHGYVEAASIEIITDRLGGLLGKDFLRFHGKIPL